VHCNECEQCRRGVFNLCSNQPVVGSSQDGGYAEMMLVRHTGLVAIPDELRSEDAAPLLCAGIATFNALKKSGAQAGDLVAVQGIGDGEHVNRGARLRAAVRSIFGVFPCACGMAGLYISRSL
jgi:alcohol dehydrogenase